MSKVSFHVHKYRSLDVCISASIPSIINQSFPTDGQFGCLLLFTIINYTIMNILIGNNKIVNIYLALTMGPAFC